MLGKSFMTIYSLLICAFIFSFSAIGRFNVVDQICAIVGQEPPILKSDVKKRAQEGGLNDAQAQKSLVRDRLLAIYGKSSKFSALDAHKAAEDHISKIMKDNHLSREQFARVLLNPPYLTTLKQFAEDTAFLILKNQIEASIASSITVSDGDIQEALAREMAHKKEYEIYFISILSTDNLTLKKSPTATNAEFNKAKLIKSQLLAKNTIKHLKNKYKDDKQVKFNGPIDYEPGILKPEYDKKIKENESSLITDPFLDGRIVTLIVRQEKSLSKGKRENVLENVRNELYKRAVQQRLDAMIEEMLNTVPVELNCRW